MIPALLRTPLIWRARQLVREAGHLSGLSITLIASEDLVIQATVVGKMLEQVGFEVDFQVLDPVAFTRQVSLSHLDQLPEQQTWDMALTVSYDNINFPMYLFYHYTALDGALDWVTEEPELRQLYEQVLRTVDRETQQALIRQMERHTHEQAYFLFLYNPIQLYAVNKAVEFVPHVTTILNLAETSVTDQHWSVRKQKATVQE
jgi:ABC-type transport system substrate-binding protein